MKLFFLSTTVVAIVALTSEASGQSQLLNADLGADQRMLARAALATSGMKRLSSPAAVAAMTPAERRAAIDALWGEGSPTAEKLQVFDRFWEYVSGRRTRLADTS